jgi:hypothetical protein
LRLFKDIFKKVEAFV